MNAQVTLTLPEGVLQQAELLAQRVGRSVPDLLAETIELSLNPLGNPINGEGSLATLTDEEVLDAIDYDLPPAQDQRLSELLDRQQAGRLDESERLELTALMQIYQTKLFRKAQGITEAVRRGLRERLCRE